MGSSARAGSGASDLAASRRVLLGVVGWGLLALLSLWAAAPPSAAAIDAPSDTASGERALEVLTRLARGDRNAGQVSLPRPLGSAANARCRERIVAELRGLGLRPEVQEAFGASAREDCAGVVRNVVCRLRGQGPRSAGGGVAARQAILCMAHYDSVGAGPGIADDLAGVAALLEVARTLQQNRPLERDVILLFEDGEELGLLGAEIFAAKHPWAKEVGAVVNVEGRGTTGPSRLFELGAGNEWLIRAFKAESTRPSVTSVSAEIYRRMPNDTDYTVWRERGIPGLNFACIGSVNRYHTPLDNLASLSVATLQHHVTNAIDAIRGLDGVEEWPARSASPPNGVFFDVAGRYLVVYKVSTARVLGVLLMIAALFAAARGIRSGHARPLWILGAMPCAGLIAFLGFALARGEGHYFRLLGVNFSAGHPTHVGPVLIGYLSAGFVGLGLGALFVGRFVRAAEIGLAVTLVLALLSGALAWEAPGLSFLVAVPASLLCLGGVVIRQRGDVSARWARVGIGALLVSGPLTLTPLHSGLINAFGVGDPGLAVIPTLFGALLLLPALMGRGRASAIWLAVIGLIAALLTGVVVSQLPVHSPDLPGHVNLVHDQVHVEAEGEVIDTASWEIQGGRGPVEPETLKKLYAALGGVLDASAGWQKARSRRSSRWGSLARTEAPLATDGMPSLEILSEWPAEGGGTVYSVAVLPGRPTDQLLVTLNGDGVLVVDGTAMADRTVRLLGPSEEGVELQIHDSGASSGLTVRLASQQFGLRGVRGRAADSYLEARPADLVPFSGGDCSWMATFKELRPPVLDLETLGPKTLGPKEAAMPEDPSESDESEESTK